MFAQNCWTSFEESYKIRTQDVISSTTSVILFRQKSMKLWNTQMALSKTMNNELSHTCLPCIQQIFAVKKYEIQRYNTLTCLGVTLAFYIRHTFVEGSILKYQGTKKSLWLSDSTKKFAQNCWTSFVWS